MTPGLYLPGASVIHRTPPAAKLLAVFAGGTLLLATTDLRVLAAAAAGVGVLYGLAGIGWRAALAQLRPVLLMLAVLCAVQWLFAGAPAAAAVGLRLLALVMLATLVTLTTRVSDMVRVVERALRPLGRVGVPTDKVSLAISMTLRFIPLLSRVVWEVREAQRARGLERSMLALAVPVLVRTLAMADQVAEAIDARSCGAS